MFSKEKIESNVFKVTHVPPEQQCDRLIVDTFDEFLGLFRKDNRFSDEFVRVEGMAAPPEPSIIFWAFFVFAAEKEVRSVLVSNLRDMFAKRRVDIQFDLNEDSAIKMLGKFITDNCPLSDNREIIINLTEDDPISNEVQKDIEEFKKQYIPTKQQNYLSIAMVTDDPSITFRSKAEIEWIKPARLNQHATIYLDSNQGSVYVTDDKHHGIISVVHDGVFKGSVYFGHSEITDETAKRLEFGLKNKDKELCYIIIAPAYDLEFSEEWCDIMRPMRNGEEVRSYALISALFKRTPGLVNPALLYGLSFSKFTVKEKRALNPIKASAESSMSMYCEGACEDINLYFNYKDGKDLYVRLVSANNAVFDLVLDVNELHKIPITNDTVYDSKGIEYECFIRKKHNIKIRTINNYGNIGCEAVGDSQPSTALAGPSASYVEDQCAFEHEPLL